MAIVRAVGLRDEAPGGVASRWCTVQYSELQVDDPKVLQALI
jgi:hypothetical protein